jgi:hypothetical protein
MRLCVKYGRIMGNIGGVVDFDPDPDPDPD